MPAGHWAWPLPTSFSQGWRVGALLFVGGQVALDGRGRVRHPYDIGAQIRFVFENVQVVLRDGGADLADIVKLNTYYVHDGRGAELDAFYEEAMKVHMEYVADPGPAATAVRVAGLAVEGLVVEIEAVAAVPEGDGSGMERTRIMPEGHWDWPLSTSFSQGWKVDDLVFVGGQVAQDSNGVVLHPGDIAAQIPVVFANIHAVLQEVGGDLADVVKLNTYYVYNGEPEGANKFYEHMTEVRLEFLPELGPAATAVRVPGLALDGLVIEIEAIALIGRG